MRRAQTGTFPAPVRGLQLSTPYLGAPADAAEVLDNFIPTDTGARLRGGCTLFATVSAAVQRLMIYRSGAVEQMFATTATTIVDVSSVVDETVAEQPDVIGLTSGDWSFQQWATAGGQFLVCVNGADYYHYYNGTEWQPIADVAIFDLDYDGQTLPFQVGQTLTGGTSGATATIISITPATSTTGTLRLGTITSGPFQNNETITTATGSALANGASAAGSTVTLTGVDGRDLSFVWSHKARLWFVEKDTLNAWYLPTNAFGGAATKFPLTSVFRLGGALLFGGTWTVDSGTGIDDMQVFVTTEGEVAVYQGTDPAAASTWAIAGLYRIARPLNKQSWFWAGSDLFIMTEEGIVALSQVMTRDRVQLQTVALTASIEDLWRETIGKRTATSRFPVTVWPSESLFIIGVPSTTGQPTCLVANTRSGAWSRIKGWDAQAVRVFNDRLYFGNTDGKVYQADVGGTDAGDEYIGVYVPKFQEYGTPDWKSAMHARAQWRSDVQASVRLVAYSNYIANALPSLPPPMPANASGTWGTVGQKWGGGTKWGAVEPVVAGTEWQSVTGGGYALAPGLVVVSNRTTKPAFELISTHLRFETGTAI